MTGLRAAGGGSRRLVVGNWKMNGDAALLSAVAATARRARGAAGPAVGLAVPHTLIAAATLADGVVAGAQDVHEAASGAHTGDVSAAMVRAAGAGFVIVGHSERRVGHGETDAAVARKVARAGEAGLDVLLCCGEPADVRAQGGTFAYVREQLARGLGSVRDPNLLVIAYEPCWAIGTGHTPGTEDIADVVGVIRGTVHDHLGADTVPIIYGGSVDPNHASRLAGMTTLDGVLVGSASLRPDAFGAIIKAFA